MGIGPEALLDALEELSADEVRVLYNSIGEPGAVAEVALRHRSQNPISSEPLSVAYVYNILRKVSDQSGQSSVSRKGSLLRGLFLEASPLEGKYIARTAIKSMLAGLGPNILIKAIALAFDMDPLLVKEAYSRLPEIGMVAEKASISALESVAARPSIPLRPMLIRRGKTDSPGFYGFKYPGMRVQIHMAEGRLFLYTLRLKNITSSLRCLEGVMIDLDQEFIAEGWLVGYQNGRMLDRRGLIRYVNRRHLSRRKSVSPCLMAFDLMYLDGEDLTGTGYAKRRRLLASFLSGTVEGNEETAGKEHMTEPSSWIMPANDRFIEAPDDVESYHRQSLESGFYGLIYHSPESHYTPGEWNKTDLMVVR